MPNTAAAPDPKDWRYLHSAEKEHWNDMKRIGKTLIPVLLMLFLATISAVGYTGIHSSAWAENIHSRFQGYLFVARLYLTFLAPLVIAIISIILLYRVVIEFVKAFYAQPQEKSILSLIQRKLLGVPALPPPMGLAWKYPFVTVKDAGDLDNNHWARWFGGPATMVVYDGTALYLERGNRFSRTIGPGSPPMPFLDRFETVKAVIDLRPQVKTGTMKPWTKDGIQVEVEIRMECKINASDEAIRESHNLVNPFDPIAVKEAAEYTAVKRNPETKQLFESDWLDGIWGQVTGYINRHISSHSIDEIALADIKDVGPSAGNLYTFQLAKDHIDQINKDLAVRKCGAHVTNIHINMKFPSEVEQKRLDYWKSERDRLSIIRDSKAEAASIRVQQEARANAERDILDAITERLKRVGPENLTEPLLLSLAGILDNSLDDPLIRPFIAKNSLELLEKLKKILNERF